MLPTYAESWFPVLLQIIFAMLVAAGMLFGGNFLGKRLRNQQKDSPYESGMKPIGSARERFSVKFYLVGMLFILFDIEAIFLYPWAVVFRDLGWLGLVEMFIFMGLVLVGFFYIWRKGALDWSPESETERK
jgi:NADH-quinone oxidoreductase subunit A